MSHLGLMFFRLVMFVGALAFLALFAAQQLTALMGETTIADGYRQIIERAPSWADRLWSAPWWVPAAAAAFPVLVLIWPTRKRSRAVPPPPKPATERDEPTEDAKPIPFEKVHEAPRPYLKDQHVYAGSAKLSMVPEFRAVPVRPIAHGKLYVEYSAYSTEAHRWEPRRRILVAEIHDQEADDWSVINIELMSSYRDDSGQLVWRWAREFDDGPPADDDYRFAIDDHYQGRVVFEGPGATVHRSYFAIMPSNDFPSDMPNLISRDIFDFVAEWEMQDQEEFLTI